MEATNEIRQVYGRAVIFRVGAPRAGGEVQAFARHAALEAPGGLRNRPRPEQDVPMQAPHQAVQMKLLLR